MSFKSLSFVSVLALSLVLAFQANLQAETDKNKDFHTIHMLMNHGLTMILDGSSLVMMAEMDMDTAILKDPIEHGNNMIAQGNTLINRALRGPIMVEKHVKGATSSDMMLITHEFGELMLKSVYSQDIMRPATQGDSSVAKNLHIIHLEANYALKMAAQGSNMVMSGQTDRLNDLNRFSIKHGKEMMKNAREILFDLLNGTAMKDLEKKDMSPADAKLFTYTKNQLINSIDIANMIYQMEFE